jgi:cytochrome b subunit of formate dehydrogenase
MLRNRLIPLLFLLFVFPLRAEPLTNQQCQECHGQKGYSVPLGGHGETERRPLYVDGGSLRESVHGELACTDCHADVKKLPHRKDGLEAVDCVTCHQSLGGGRWAPGSRAAWLAPEPPAIVVHTRDYTLSAHADDSVANNADCATCHTAHYVFPSDDSRASTHRLKSPRMCGSCHEEELEQYRMSMHGAALKTPWKGDSATCSDCHSSHRISDMKKTPAHRLVTENCGECHQAELDGYMASPHGQLAWHGNEEAPKCVDCHDGHEITHVSDIRSPVNPANRVETCRKCHESANEQFAKYDPHATTSDFGKYPGMWLLGKGMGALIILVILFFYLHSVLWFWREKKERPVIYRHSDSRSYPVRVKPEKKRSGIHFQRFPWYWRVNHWLLALSLMSLVFTGMVVMYPNTAWAMAVVPALGGPEILGTIHHWVGVVFLLTIFGHAAVVLVRVLRDKDFDWFGPDSLLPRKKDWEDMKAQFRWYFGKGPQPRFDRWTYWEKFDYWAVYWGALVIGLSGILLWLAESVGQVLPGWIFNLATVAHGLEAFLAVMTLFVVHFFNNHFRPAKFPLDTVMFTGSWDLEELKEERPEEYQRLKATGELEKRLVAPPSRAWDRLSHILGFSLLGIGLILLVLVVNGFFTQGLY